MSGVALPRSASLRVARPYLILNVSSFRLQRVFPVLLFSDISKQSENIFARIFFSPKIFFSYKYFCSTFQVMCTFLSRRHDRRVQRSIRSIHVSQGCEGSTRIKAAILSGMSELLLLFL